MSRFGGYLPPNTELSVLESSTWAELLSFTSSDHSRAFASLDAKSAEWQELQLQEQYLDAVVSSSKLLYSASPDNKSRGPTATPSRVSTTEKTTEDRRTLFREFADNEKLRLRAAQEAKRNRARYEKHVKLNDLKKFAERFKLKGRVPADLLPILAKDQEKQLDIARKAEESVRSNDDEGSTSPEAGPVRVPRFPIPYDIGLRKIYETQAKSTSLSMGGKR